MENPAQFWLEINSQLHEKRGRPDAGARLCGNLANPKVATFCAAHWHTFTLPLTPGFATVACLNAGFRGPPFSDFRGRGSDDAVVRTVADPNRARL